MDGVIGVIWMFGGNFAPRSWAFCDGQLLPIGQNQALFSILGTTFGGDGRTTFALPGLRGRTPIHAGNGPGLSDRRLGSRGGTEHNNLIANQLPSHTHAATATVQGGSVSATLQATSMAGDSAAPTGNLLANTGAFDNEYKIPSSGITLDEMSSDSIDVDYTAPSVNVTIGNTGASQAVHNMQPWLAVNAVICLQGVFPSRS